MSPSRMELFTWCKRVILSVQETSNTNKQTVIKLLHQFLPFELHHEEEVAYQLLFIFTLKKLKFSFDGKDHDRITLLPYIL